MVSDDTRGALKPLFDLLGLGECPTDEEAAAVEKILTTPMSEEEAERQTRDFAYGNAKISNDHVTREMVDRAAEDFAMRKEGVPPEMAQVSDAEAYENFRHAVDASSVTATSCWIEEAIVSERTACILLLEAIAKLEKPNSPLYRGIWYAVLTLRGRAKTLEVEAP